MSSFGRELFQLGYEISPIMLVNGIAALIPGQMLPIVALTEAANFTESLLSGTVPGLDQFFAHWKPLPGTTLIQNQVGQGPFANQAIAGDCIIAEPLTISMLMQCPVQKAGGYPAKLATLTVLQQTLYQHNNAGGTYTIATPSQIWTGCLLTSVQDVTSGGESKQVQTAWQFNFIQPLTTINAAQQVFNSLMNKIQGGLPTSLAPAVSGIDSTVGQADGAIAYSVPLSGGLGDNTLAGTPLDVAGG